ncbi:MAG: HAMP domain-containing histidine kinase [Defluviitaleaceae bacterium]|nr:HAMP domain-containing histidine kinase [Defluviitaleaceae bacterium]
MRNLPLQKEKTVDIPDNLSPVYVNAEELTQVIFNLLQNAKNHTANGNVTIKLSVDDNTLKIIVSDTGSGIAPELLPYVFERGSHGNEGGTGLGLAICRVKHLLRTYSPILTRLVVILNSKNRKTSIARYKHAGLVIYFSIQKLYTNEKGCCGCF